MLSKFYASAEAIENAKEAIEPWLETVIDDGGTVPEARAISDHYSDPEYAGWVWAVVGVDLAALSDKVERVNITLPVPVLRRIDVAAAEAGERPSGSIARRVLAD